MRRDRRSKINNGQWIIEEQAVYYSELLSQGSYIVLVKGTEAEINGAKAILINHQIANWNVYNAPDSRGHIGI